MIVETTDEQQGQAHRSRNPGARFEFNGGNLGRDGVGGLPVRQAGHPDPSRRKAPPRTNCSSWRSRPGAEDVRDVGEAFEVVTTPGAYHKGFKEALETAKVAVEAAAITYMPWTTIAVEGDLAARLLKLVDAAGGQRRRPGRSRTTPNCRTRPERPTPPRG